jgi:Siphovirus Gp157
MTPAHPRESLYQIEDSLQQIADARAAAEADGDTEALKVIDQLEREYLTKQANKVTSYAGLIRSRQDRVEACEKEIDRMKALRDAAQADVERLKANALAVMQQFEVKSLTDERTGRGLRRQGNGGLQALEIAEWPKDSSGNFKPLPAKNVDAVDYKLRGLPVQLFMVPDTERIREALKQRIKCPECKGIPYTFETADGKCPRCKGEGTIPQTIPGVRLLERGEHVRVI